MNAMKETLHLTLHKRWFDAIARGEKTEEYREIKPFWEKRLSRGYSTIRFRNGYAKNAPEMEVEFLGVHVGQSHENKTCFVISLGKILWVENWNQPYSIFSEFPFPIAAPMNSKLPISRDVDLDILVE